MADLTDRIKKIMLATTCATALNGCGWFREKPTAHEAEMPKAETSDAGTGGAPVDTRYRCWHKNDFLAQLIENPTKYRKQGAYTIVPHDGSESNTVVGQIWDWTDAGSPSYDQLQIKGYHAIVFMPVNQSQSFAQPFEYHLSPEQYEQFECWRHTLAMAGRTPTVREVDAKFNEITGKCKPDPKHYFAPTNGFNCEAEEDGAKDGSLKITFKGPESEEISYLIDRAMKNAMEEIAKKTRFETGRKLNAIEVYRILDAADRNKDYKIDEHDRD